MKLLKLLSITVFIILAAIFMLPSELGGFLKLYYVSSSSMEPNIPIGSLIIASPITFIGLPDIGDVVIYVDKDLGRLVSHRVVGLDGDGYIIKADVGGSGTYIPRRDVIAKSLVVLPLVGWLGIISNMAPLLIIVLIAVLLVSPSKGGSFYPISSALSTLPLIFPLKPDLPRLFGAYTNIALTGFLASGSIILYIAERGGFRGGLVDLTYILLSIAAVMVVEIPWLK